MLIATNSPSSRAEICAIGFAEQLLFYLVDTVYCATQLPVSGVLAGSVLLGCLFGDVCGYLCGCRSDFRLVAVS